MNVLIFVTLLCGTCFGNPLSKPDSRIFGGQDARVGEYPFIVSLRAFDDHFCGGSIINRRWVLTAAHCIVRKHYTAIQVVTASINSIKPGEEYRCEASVIHENFVYAGFDIALLKTTKDFDFNNPLIQPIAIDFSFPYANTPVTAIGWGDNYVFPNGTTTVVNYHLQKLNTYILEDSQCQRIREGEMCIYQIENVGLCVGDSGSPVIAFGKQVGIAARIVGQCTDGNPCILTRLYNYQDWIMGNTDSW